MERVPMSPDELVLLVGSPIAALYFWYGWYATLGSINRLGARSPGRNLFGVVPFVAALLLSVVLRTIASFDVVNDVRYLLMYFFMGAAWVGVALRFLPFVGLDASEDVVERGNAAAAPAVGGAVLGLTLSFAGGNIGDGPGWWVVVFAAGLATAGFFLVWLALDRIGGVTETVTVDRDLAAGRRLGGFLIATGLVLGRGVAGDWVSAGATLHDFVVVAWPLLILVVAAAMIDRAARPRADQPPASAAALGALPAALYVAAAAAYVAILPRP